VRIADEEMARSWFVAVDDPAALRTRPWTFALPLT
jgi:hypothetical protein